LPYTAIHSAQASMPATGVDGQVWLDTDGTLAGQDFVPLSGGTMTGNLNTPSINSGGITGDNLIINGNFDFWQRGVSFSGQEYTADRWLSFANDSVTRQSFSLISEIPGAQFYLRKTPVQSGGAYHALQQTIENGGNDLSGKTVTLSFWARRNTASDYAMEVFSNLNNDQQTATSTITLTGTWTKYITTWTIPVTNGTNAHRYIRFNPQADARGFDLAQVKLELGSNATPFSRAGGTIQGELAACQRYYYRTTSTGGFAGIGGNGFTYSATQANVQLQLPVPMRTYPSSCDVSNIRYVDSANGAANITQVAMWQIPASVTNATVVDFQAIGTGFTSGRYVFLQTSAGNGYLGFSAEL
jgi:hypothetical protein